MISTSQENKQRPASLPHWFRQDLPDMLQLNHMKELLHDRELTTVCQHAHCPNLGTCWGKGVATFMILGDQCTRSCKFCAVKIGESHPVDQEEPKHVAQMVKDLNLRYVVITSVTRDDLPDQGAGHFVETVSAIRHLNPKTKIELLIPDFSADIDLLKSVVKAGPDVLGHNMEMVSRFFPRFRPRTSYERSLRVLKLIKDMSASILVKSGFMVGLGENDQEINVLMDDICNTGCDLLTIGQYLAPSRGQRHVPVDRFVHPDMFEQYRINAKAKGFRHVMSGPLVRSSYIAEAGYQACMEQD